MCENQGYSSHQPNTGCDQQPNLEYAMNRVQVQPHHSGFEPNYGQIIEAPMHFYSQANYDLPPQYTPVGKIWNNENAPSNMAVGMNGGRDFCVVTDSSKQIRWAMHQPTYPSTVPVPSYNSRQNAMCEQNGTLDAYFQKTSEKKRNHSPSYPPPNHHAAVITHTNEYKDMIENHDPVFQPLDKNWNASTRRVESETRLATNNLTNVLNADENSNTDTQEPVSESSNKRTTRSSRMRIYKHQTPQESVERNNNTDLIHMKIKANSSVMDGHGPSGDGFSAPEGNSVSGDGEPPVKVQKIAHTNETNKKNFDKYQISSNVHTLQPKHIISWYLDYLIGENEDVTEMSKSFTIPMNIFASDDFYYMESLQKKTSFPTPKFLHWMKINFPSINVSAIDFHKKGANGVHVTDPKRYWMHKTPHDVIKEVFYHFQEERILQ